MTPTVDLAPLLGRVPALVGADGSGAVRLAGLTNINWLIEHRSVRYVLRVPGAGTSDYIDRQAEAVAAKVAADAGVNAELVFFDSADGLMVTRYVEGAVTMDQHRFTDLGSVGRAAQTLRRLHSCGGRFAVDFNLFGMIDEYKALLVSKGAPLPVGYDDVQSQATAARTVLESRPVLALPAHCDPLCENFLDTGHTMHLIDYEYAGNNDPMWDLGDLSVEGAFESAQDEALLRAYFGGEPPPNQRARMVIYKALCDLLWTLWGVIQQANGNPADDFGEYARRRFNRCAALMSSDVFASSVATL